MDDDERGPDDRDADAQPDGRDETAAEKADRNFGELLQELRVAQVGVQILFASLLTIVFSQRFNTISSLQRGTYVVTLLSAACSVALLVGPVAFHRIVFRHSQKDDLVRVTRSDIRRATESVTRLVP